MEVFREFSKESISDRIVAQIAELSLPRTGEQLVEVPKAVFQDVMQQRVDEQVVDRCHGSARGDLSVKCLRRENGG